MKTHKLITISAALVITVVEAMVFNHETAAAADTTSPSATASLGHAVASNLHWLGREVESSLPGGRTHEPERAQP
jgi:hypothetical protein